MATSVDILINGSDKFSPAANSAVSGLQRLNDALHGTQGRLREFNTVMELAFGFHVGRFLFEKIHEGIAKIGEGFIEARDAGLSFGESIQDAVNKGLGLATMAEKLKEAAKATKDFNDAFNRARDSMAPPGAPPGWPLVPGSGTAMENLLAARSKAFEAVQPAWKAEKEAGKASWLDGLGVVMAGVLGYGKEEAGELRDRLRARQERTRELFGTQLSDFRAANDALSGYARTSEAANTARGAFGLFKQLPGMLADVTAPSANPLKDFSVWMSSHIADGLLAAGAFGRRGREYNELVGKLQGAEAERDRLRGLPDHVRRELQSVGAENMRFLTRGPGPLHSPEVEAVKDVKKAIDAQTKIIDDLKRAISKIAGNIGVVGAF